MLYIFQVDSGCLLTFDMNLALDSVSQLKEEIEKLYNIPTDQQVLLVSGGEGLDPGARVCSYSAGTDTNPIYLFSKATLECPDPPSLNLDCSSDIDLKDQVDATSLMPATYNTVVVRSKLAQKFWELAREQTHACEQLVHEQHLQQQGWAAAVANLDDVTTAFKNRAEIFEQSYRQHLASRDESLASLKNFGEDLLTLSKIPILEPLLEIAWSFSSGEGPKESGDEKSQSELSGMSLLQWISAADNGSTLEQVAALCTGGLKQYNEALLEVLKKDADEAIESSMCIDMREIKGLEERLFGLEQLMCETKKIGQEQSDLAQSFIQNQNRASNLGDTSILPDLCASHRKQLQVMLQNQQKLKDIRRRCTKAKEELGVNLYYRLRWVIYVENRLTDVNNKLMIYHENLKRVKKYLDIIKQVQRAPQMYVSAVGEVVRRRTFSQAYLNWAGDLSCRLLTICNEECERRRDFSATFDGHFLQGLFPGFEDNLPTFATQAPPPFDNILPKISVEDMKQLNLNIPDLELNLSATKLSENAQLLLTKSVSERSKEDERLVRVLLNCKLQTDNKCVVKSVSSHLHKDDKDFESETDTEEFEKVCQSPVDLNFETKSDPAAEVKTEESEVESLKQRLSAAGKLANDTATYLRSELCKIRNKSETDGEVITNLVSEIQQHVIQLSASYTYECESLVKKLQQVETESSQEIALLKQVMCEKEAAISVLEANLNELRSSLDTLIEEKVVLETSLKSSSDKCLELSEKLDNQCGLLERVNNEHNAEIIKMRCELSVLEDEKREAVESKKLLQVELARIQLDVEVEKEKLTSEHEIQIQELQVKMLDERDKYIREVVDKLTLENKIELENLRSRYRLMSAASMEKSPSDSSLEKIERFDMIELTNHEAILAQMRDVMTSEKEEAIKLTMDNCKKKIDEEIKACRQRMEEEKQVWLNEAVTRASVDKDKQIEQLMMRQENLITECQRHRDTIRLLTDGDHIRVGSSPGAGTVDPLLERIESLERERTSLKHELEREKKKNSGSGGGSTSSTRHVGDVMSCSVAVVTPPVVEAVSQEVTEHSKQIDKLSKSTTTLVQQGKISITTCSPGDAVLVVWDVEHTNYTILQESSTLYFLHADCLDTLGLRPSSDGSPRRLYSTAVVIDKEYCHAKKSENRYHVPKGTKFYRVKVKQLTKDSKESSLTRSHHSSRQQTSSRVTSSDSPLSLPSSSHCDIGESAGCTSSQDTI